MVELPGMSRDAMPLADGSQNRGQQVRPGAHLQTADCRLQIAKRIAEDRPCFKHKKHNYMYLLL
jgi:hypothetical protein